jgi:ribose transport system ATP-binding protein
LTDVLRIEHLSKTFPGQKALDDVDLSVAPGEVHALVGQNGSGKSTLIKILAGYHEPDDGARATVDGAPLALGDGQAATDLGLRFVHQDLGLVGDLNTIENLALTTGFRTGFAGRIRWAHERRGAKEALEALGITGFDVRAPISTLSPSQRTAVAIARALSNSERCKLLILDEPTATLPDDDVKRLFTVIHRLKTRGVAILYVSHHLDEVFELSDRVTVLRDARKVGTVNVKELNHQSLIELIVGHRIEQGTATETLSSDDVVLSVRGLQGASVKTMDFDVARGEIVGIAGITGSGREHVLGLLMGQQPRDDGTVTVEGRNVPNYRPRGAMDVGMAFIPADRSVRGVIAPMSVRENMTVTGVGKHTTKGRISHSSEVAETTSWVEKLSIRLPSIESLIGLLSGGNQQKVMLAKALRLDPKLLLLDQPTQGIDVGAKDQIHRLIDAAAADGVSTLVASTDTDELVRLCHRVIVMSEGRIATILTGSDIVAPRIEHTQLQSSRSAS